MRLSYSRSMVACCAAAATAGDSEESRLLVPGWEQGEAPVVRECFCSEVEQIPFFWIEKFEVNGMSRIWIRPGSGMIRKQIGSTSIRWEKSGITSQLYVFLSAVFLKDFQKVYIRLLMRDKSFRAWGEGIKYDTSPLKGLPSKLYYIVRFRNISGTVIVNILILFFTSRSRIVCQKCAIVSS